MRFIIYFGLLCVMIGGMFIGLLVAIFLLRGGIEWSVQNIGTVILYDSVFVIIVTMVTLIPSVALGWVLQSLARWEIQQGLARTAIRRHLLYLSAIVGFIFSFYWHQLGWPFPNAGISIEEPWLEIFAFASFAAPAVFATILLGWRFMENEAGRCTGKRNRTMS